MSFNVVYLKKENCKTYFRSFAFSYSNLYQRFSNDGNMQMRFLLTRLKRYFYSERGQETKRKGSRSAPYLKSQTLWLAPDPLVGH